MGDKDSYTLSSSVLLTSVGFPITGLWGRAEWPFAHMSIYRNGLEAVFRLEKK